MSMGEAFKVVLLGEGSVGKTSLFMMFIHGSFNPKHKTTLQATFESKKITLPDKSRVEINIWDTAGQERFHTLGPIYYRNAKGAILVYDITDANSFVRVQNWVKELRKILGNNVTLVIVGNKIDMEKSRVVSQKEAEEFAASVGATHFHTSAKMNQGVAEMFTELTRLIVEKTRKEGGGLEKKPSQAKGFVIGETTPQNNTSSEGCCSS
eukprot:TRINITY_DN320_c1_g1_i1.p1 TRINITY_DN320_c1_g1~~TRINITY_DN320_c1_g1_i1.p1  ORF type:complete len:209 (-),score=33.55 TRINITY_DN320_c1_g1_i1:361-987(-)